MSKRKLPALHLFVGTDAHIQFRQGLGLHFFLARKERERELAKDYFIDGLYTLVAKIATISAEGGSTWDPNYTLGSDLLDHDFL